jgi:hypothetical protein
VIPAHASSETAARLSGEKSGVKIEGNQTGVDRPSFAQDGRRRPILANV